MKHIAALILVVVVLLLGVSVVAAEGIPPNDPQSVVVEGKFVSRYSDRVRYADGAGNLICTGGYWLNIYGLDNRPYTCPASYRVYTSAASYPVGRPLWAQVCYRGWQPLLLR